MNNKPSGLRAYAIVGLELNVSLLLGFFAGRWLDEKWQTSPWFTVTLTSAGFVWGVFSLHRMAKQADDPEARETDGKRGDDDDGQSQ